MGNPTPGPWRLALYGEDLGRPTIMRNNDGSFIVLAGEAEDTRQVAVVPMSFRAKRGESRQTDDPEALATARGIAALPDLLTALELARDCIAYCRRAHKDAQSGDGVPVEIFINAAIAKARGE